MAYTYSKLGTATVSSSIPNISFLNIPQNYTDLVIKISARGDRASTNVDQLKINFNQSTTGYSWKTLYGLGASGTGSGSSSSDSTIPNLWENSTNSTASTFNNMEIYIPNYTSGNFKSVSVDVVTEGNVTGSTVYDIFTGFVAGLWSNTQPITSITIAQYIGTNILQYSTATLYGIKAEV